MLIIIFIYILDIFKAQYFAFKIVLLLLVSFAESHRMKLIISDGVDVGSPSPPMGEYNGINAIMIIVFLNIVQNSP